MKRLLIIITFGTILGCSNEQLQIKKEFIINDYWSEHNNAIQIERMVVIDSTLNIFSPTFKGEPNHRNIVNKLERDSTFVCYYSGLNVLNNTPMLKGKVYFDRYNGWDWTLNGQKSKTIGQLSNNTWYKFSKLQLSAIYHYVYIDSLGQSHKFTANLNNF